MKIDDVDIYSGYSHTPYFTLAYSLGLLAMTRLVVRPTLKKNFLPGLTPMKLYDVDTSHGGYDPFALCQRQTGEM